MGTLTELVGCAGVGKTQWALQMACQCPGATIFIDTEAKVSLSRLQEMATHHRTNVMSRVTVHSSNNFVELCQVLGQMEDTILNHNNTSSSSRSTVPPVKLLVIDSIAAPVRRHDFGSAAAQAAAVLQLAQTVKRLADQFQLVALVINQVASSSSSSVSSSSLSIPAPQQQQQQQSTTKAALGTAWHHCVSTRVELELRTAPGDSIVSRHATVVKSNLVGASPPLEFKITTQGLVAV